ncbi:hypothetical protein QTO30_00885 [Yoonia sp. GPGPB17]
MLKRDPEDAHGWRYLSEAPPTPFDTEAAAREAALRDVKWMTE